MMKWLRIFVCAGSILAICFNLSALLKYVASSYETPLETRSLAGKHNMAEMIALADQYLPANRKTVKLGIWNPVVDPVSVNHLDMILTYNLYPVKVVTAQSNNIERLDYITGYCAHMEWLKPVLSELNQENSMIQIGSNTEFSLLERSGKHATPANEKCHQITSHPGLLTELAGMFIGFAALTATGWMFLGSFFPCATNNSMGWKMLLAWTSGLLLIVLLMPLLCLIGLRISLVNFILLLSITMALIALFRPKREENFNEDKQPSPPQSEEDQKRRTFHRIAVSAAAIFSLAWCVLIILESASSPLSDITGIGVWGLKAKAFYETGGIDFSLLKDPECGFCHPTYPLGFPMLLAYCYTWMGGVDDWLIRQVPAITGMAVGVFLVFILTQMGTTRICSVIASLLFCSGTIFSTQSTFVEAETVLLLMCLPGFFFLMEYLRNGKHSYLWLGMLFLAGAACVKKEGIVFFAVGVLLTVLLSKGFDFKAKPQFAIRDSVILIAIVILFILPWQLYCRWNNLPVNDFNGATVLTRTAEENALLWSNGIKSFLNQMLLTPSSVSWIWITGTVTALTNLRQLRARKELTMLLASSCILVLFFGSIYVFSIYSEYRLEWHMQASERLLLLPTCLFMIMTTALLVGKSRKENNAENQNIGPSL